MRAVVARIVRFLSTKPFLSARPRVWHGWPGLACALMLAVGHLVADAHAADTAVLGTPAKGSTVSGVGVISGYHCTSKNIEVCIDGVSVGMAGAGTTLLGTLGVCGHTDTGYSLLYNFNNLSEGSHVVSAYADGVQFGANTIYTVRSGGVPWLSGVSERVTVLDFPYVGDVATLQWNQSMQNFLVTETAILGPTGADVSSLRGRHRVSRMNSTFTGGGCLDFGSLSNIDVSVVVQDNIATLVLGGCTFTLGNATGSKTSGFDMIGTVRCEYPNGTALRVRATSSKLRYESFFDELRGDLIVHWGDDLANDCRERLSFW